MDLESNETSSMIASDKVEGTAVYNEEGERLGTIRRFMVDKLSGQVEYAVLTYGGLFGMGDKEYPLPWETLNYDTDQGGYVVNLTKEQLEGAPSYTGDSDEPSYDSDYNQRVYGYYGLTYA